MIDIRIFGVPERIENIHKLQNYLCVPDNRVIFDYKYEGCKPTAKRAWLIDTDADFVMVLADDVATCTSFIHFCGIVTEKFPDSIISLYPGQFPRRDYLKQMPERSPYITVSHCSGAGIIMPTKYVKPCVESWRDDISGDDANIDFWAKENGIQMITTIPSLIQHLDFRSLFDPTRSLGGTEFFEENPYEVNWRETYLESWTNIAKYG